MLIQYCSFFFLCLFQISTVIYKYKACHEQDHRSVTEPSSLFESMVVVGLHPNTDVQELQQQILERSNEDPKRPRSIFNYHHQVHADLNLEPQVFFFNQLNSLKVSVLFKYIHYYFNFRISSMLLNVVPGSWLVFPIYSHFFLLLVQRVFALCIFL